MEMKARQDYLEHLLGNMNPFNNYGLFKVAKQVQRGLGFPGLVRRPSDWLYFGG